MAAQKCVHKGCGKVFTDPNEDCIYHPGPPVFHEGQKGWKCCKPRVLTFDEFLDIPPCTTGKHSTVDDTAQPEPTKNALEGSSQVVSADSVDGQKSSPKPFPHARAPPPPQETAPPVAAAPETDSDDASISIKPGTTCRRRGCDVAYGLQTPRESESCVHHPGMPVFHEGTKGWTCCKRRVLEFDEFMKMEGCKTKTRHMFVGSGKNKKEGAGGEQEEAVESVRNEFYQTGTSVIVSLYLKKIDKDRARVEFVSDWAVELDLPTTDGKRYKATVPLYGPIKPDESTFQIMGTKLELTLVKADGSGWPVLRSDERQTGEIIQVGKAGRA